VRPQDEKIWYQGIHFRKRHGLINDNHYLDEHAQARPQKDHLYAPQFSYDETAMEVFAMRHKEDPKKVPEHVL
jgi:hypothetical protein